MTNSKPKPKAVHHDVLLPIVPPSTRGLDLGAKVEQSTPGHEARHRGGHHVRHISDPSASPASGRAVCADLGLYAGRRPGMWFAPPGAGKTYAAMALGVAYAAGDSHALGGTVRLESSGPLVWLAYEGDAEVRDRLRDTATAMGHPPDGLAAHIVEEPGADGALEAIAHHLRWHADCLVIIDSLAGILHSRGIDEITRAAADPLRGLAKLAKTTGACVLVIHHGTDYPRGNKDIHAACHQITKLSASGDIRTLTSWKTNGAPHGAIKYRMRFGAAGSPNFAAASESKDITEPALHRSGDDHRDRVLTALRTLKGVPTSQRKLGAALKMSNATVGIHLSALESAGLVTRTAKGWTTIHEAVS